MVLTLRADYAGNRKDRHDYWYLLFYVQAGRKSDGPWLIEGLEDTITFVGTSVGK